MFYGLDAAVMNSFMCVDQGVNIDSYKSLLYYFIKEEFLICCPTASEKV